MCMEVVVSSSEGNGNKFNDLKAYSIFNDDKYYIRTDGINFQ